MTGEILRLSIWEKMLEARMRESYFAELAKGVHNATKQGSAIDLGEQWGRLAGEYEEVWNNIDGQEAPAIFQHLLDAGQRLSRLGMDFPVEPRRLARCLDFASGRYLTRYA